MKMSEAFPSKYLKAADLNGRAVRAIIDNCTYEDMGDGTSKPVLSFRGQKKGLVLNKTNAAMIASSYGDDSDAWRGRELEIYPDKTSMQGRIVDCLRVRVPVAPATPAPAAVPSAAGEPFNDDASW